MSLTPTQLQELQTIVLDLGEEFPHNADALWNAAIRIQTGGLGPTSGAGGQPAFDAAVADIKACQEAVQTYQQRQGSPNSGFDVAVLQVVPATSTFPTGNVSEILYLQTAPNSYVATDQIVIDPVGPNSVQMDEVGTTVFRTVPAASGGVEINNLSTGAGFERVLTTADLGGGVASLTGGVNINLTGTGTDPIVNLDVAITGVSVNGVTLSAAGAATDYLDETGAYSTPPITSPAGADTQLQFNNAGVFGASADLTWDGVVLAIGDPGSADQIDIGHDGTIGTINIVNGDLHLGPTLTAGHLIMYADAADVLRTENFGIAVLDGAGSLPRIDLSSDVGTQLATIRLQAGGVPRTELRSFVNSDFVSLRGATSVGAEVILFEGDPDGAVGLFRSGAEQARTLAGGSGGFEVNNTLTGAGFERVLTVSDLGIGGSIADDQVAVGNGANAIDGSSALTFDGIDLDIVGTGGLVITNGADAFAIRVATDINITAAGSPDLNITGVIAINAGTVDADFDNLTATDFNGVALTTGGAATNFLNETGAYSVPPSAGVNNPMTVDLDGDGFNIDDLGVIFMREQAASDPDVPTQGQLWVRDDSFANTLMFTTGQGNEYEVAGIPYDGDLLDGAGSLSTTTFVGWVNIGPKPNTWYTLICQGQAVAPAADDVKVQLTVDTNSVFQGLYVDSNGQQVAMRSAIGEVVTNTVVVDTDGSATDDGTFFTITGALKAGATGQTVSLRAAKNADTGANGFIYFPTMSVVRLSET